jgi:protein-disulfide isomerase
MFIINYLVYNYLLNKWSRQIMQFNNSSTPGLKKILGFFVGGLLLGIIGTAGFMIAKNNKKALDVVGNAVKPVITVDGKTWSTDSLPGDSMMDYYTLRSNIYNAEKSFMSQTAARIALAHDAGKPVSKEELPRLDELLPSLSITDEEARRYYDEVVARMGTAVLGGQSFDAIKIQLKMQMAQQKTADLVMKKIHDFEAGGRIKVLLNPPQSQPVKLDVNDYPSRGNKNADTVLVEVADYMCAHCREAEAVLENIYQEFSSKVKFVSVSYPLSVNGLSGALTRGAFCASQQGEKQFWDYNSLAFQVPYSKMEASGQDPAKAFHDVAIETAKMAKLDEGKFASCLNSAEAIEHIKKVQNQFNSATGFKGTPTFYLNGRLIQVSPSQLEATLKTALK